MQQLKEKQLPNQGFLIHTDEFEQIRVFGSCYQVAACGSFAQEVSRERFFSYFFFTGLQYSIYAKHLKPLVGRIASCFSSEGRLIVLDREKRSIHEITTRVNP